VGTRQSLEGFAALKIRKGHILFGWSLDESIPTPNAGAFLRELLSFGQAVHDRHDLLGLPGQDEDLSSILTDLSERKTGEDVPTTGCRFLNYRSTCFVGVKFDTPHVAQVSSLLNFQLLEVVSSALQDRQSNEVQSTLTRLRVQSRPWCIVS
jgi:hypothetical protein